MSKVSNKQEENSIPIENSPKSKKKSRAKDVGKSFDDKKTKGDQENLKKSQSIENDATLILFEEVDVIFDDDKVIISFLCGEVYLELFYCRDFLEH
jgi:hypothetical protein